MLKNTTNYLFPVKEPSDFHRVHTLIIGSGAAGLNAAVQLFRNGVKDILILTEGLNKGTSINTGSDKQTYYKLSMCGSENDSPESMAESYLFGGAMHGDIALIESSLSSKAFFNLVNLGIPFPHDKYGQYVGYKTDHDPHQRATSVGPYTSQEMCKHLANEVKNLGIPIYENREVIKLVTTIQNKEKRIVGAVAIFDDKILEAYIAENIIFAVGGPGGLYKTSVYPEVHFGSIGLALMEGAEANNLPESQFGLASVKFRWNVSGTYMQVIPKFISRAPDGVSDEREFLIDYFDSAHEMNGNVFLKGYQWPFDANKVFDGSSIIDILVYIETVENNRRVFLDFRKNPHGFSIENLPDDAKNYLIRSNAAYDSPIERLSAMNPGAIELFKHNNIDLFTEPLEIAVCAQHNNGGLSGSIWWESTNIKHFFPIGEVNGSHGVNRPGGSALNSGQVGGFRAAEFIANQYSNSSLDYDDVNKQIRKSLEEVVNWTQLSKQSPFSYKNVLKDIQNRMTFVGSHIRSKEFLEDELAQAKKLVREILSFGCSPDGDSYKMAFRALQLSYAHWIYLESINIMLDDNVGSRGSYIVLDPFGKKINNKLSDKWRIQLENPSFRNKILVTQAISNDSIDYDWKSTRPVPQNQPWFETVWSEFLSGEIYK